MDNSEIKRVSDMAKRFREARKMNGLKLTEAAQKLGVSQPTLSAWEGERKSPTLNGLERMANLYGVTTDYLLGRNDIIVPDAGQIIPHDNLKIMHAQPVWSEKYGWLLVDAIKRILVTVEDEEKLPFFDVGEIRYQPTAFSNPECPLTEPLDKSDLVPGREIWVEPISPDAQLRQELRGWYRIKDHIIENSSGNRFTLDSYGAKWVAYSDPKI